LTLASYFPIFSPSIRAEQLIGVVLGRQLDDIAALITLTPGQDLENGTLADPAIPHHDALRAGADPVVGLGFHEILFQPPFDIPFCRRGAEIDGGRGSELGCRA
jgi:hypothetical protein